MNEVEGDEPKDREPGRRRARTRKRAKPSRSRSHLAFGQGPVDAGSNTPNTPATIARNQILEGGIEDVYDAVSRRARKGDMNAVRFMFDRLTEKSIVEHVQFDLRPVSNADEAMAAISDVLAAMSSGLLSIDQSERIISLLQSLSAYYTSNCISKNSYDCEKNVYIEKHSMTSDFDNSPFGRSLARMNEKIEEKLTDLHIDSVIESRIRERVRTAELNAPHPNESSD